MIEKIVSSKKNADAFVKIIKKNFGEVLKIEPHKEYMLHMDCTDLYEVNGYWRTSCNGNRHFVEAHSKDRSYPTWDWIYTGKYKVSYERKSKMRKMG